MTSRRPSPTFRLSAAGARANPRRRARGGGGQPCLRRAPRARRCLASPSRRALHRAARAERRRQEHAVRADHAAVRPQSGGSASSAMTSSSEPARRCGARRGVPEPHARSRSVGDAEPALSRRPARHGRAEAGARRATARAIGLADRAGDKVRDPLRRPVAAAGDCARAAAPAAPVAARRGHRRARRQGAAPRFSPCSAPGDATRASACCGRRICSTRSSRRTNA